MRRAVGAPAQAPIVLTSPPDARLAGEEGAVLARLAILAAAVMECTRGRRRRHGATSVRAVRALGSERDRPAARDGAGHPLGVMSGGPFGPPSSPKAGVWRFRHAGGGGGAADRKRGEGTPR